MNMFQKWHITAPGVLRAVGSRLFFRLTLLLFVLQASWVAVTGAYSMAFDEYFHFGLIKLYAQQWSPLIHQPEGAASFGAIARDPSYLYHYLMSFPYRLIAHFTTNAPVQIVLLRGIDIALFAAGLVLFRKIFRAAGLSAVVSNTVLLFFVLVPVTSFVAGQINYDNLLFFMTGLTLYLSLRLVAEIRARKHVPVVRFFVLASCLLLASIVKYAFLPLFMGIVLYVLLAIRREIGLNYGKLWQAVRRGSDGLQRFSGIVVCLLVVGSFGLFMERYAVNVVRYHTLTPECDVVLDVEDCRAYDPFGRNQSYKEAGLKDGLEMHDKLSYPEVWARGMMRSLYFTVGPREQNYPPGEPLPVAYVTAWAVVFGGTGLLVWHLRRLLRQNQALQLFVLVSGIYLGILFVQNLTDFLSLGVAVAVQGRYLLPVLPLVLALVALAAQRALRQFRPAVGVMVAGGLLVLTLQGGGLLPYIIRSADTWMWPNQTVQHVTHTTRSLLWYITVRS